MASQKHELKRIMWPCDDGPRVCDHPRNKPYKRAVPEVGYTLDQECLDCGAVWREKVFSRAKEIL